MHDNWVGGAVVDDHIEAAGFSTGSGPAGGYVLAGDLATWQSDARIVERGYHWPWTSRIGSGNGEDAFIRLLGRHLSPDTDALDLGCGHGELAMAVAGRCRSVVGVDLSESPIGLAKELARERGIDNADFFVHRFLPQPPSPPLPLEDGSVSLVYGRRGPIARLWMPEILRVAKPGTPIVLLHPGGLTPPPVWRDQLPEAFRQKLSPNRVVPYELAEKWIAEPFLAAGIIGYSLWWFDTPEWFDSAEGLYGYLAMNVDDAPEFPAVAGLLRRIIDEYGDEDGLPLRQRRMLAFGRLPG